MNIKDKTTNERKIFAHFDRNDIIAILSNKVMEETGIVIDKNTDVSIRFHKKDNGSRGFGDHIEFTITNDLTQTEGDFE